jgi:hypothetical protein
MVERKTDTELELDTNPTLSQRIHTMNRSKSDISTDETHVQPRASHAYDLVSHTVYHAKHRTIL